MTQVAIKPRWTFEEYIDFCAQTDERYELVQGELRHMNPPSWLHLKIAKLLEQVFDAEIERLGYPWEAFREPGQRTEFDSSRLPDVAVVPVEAIEKVLDQSAVLQVPAILVVEVVSPSSASEDYNEKLKEYQSLPVLEYWVIDPDALGAAKYLGFPKAPTVSIYSLENGEYQLTQFRDQQAIASPTFPSLKLTAEQILRGKR